MYLVDCHSHTDISPDSKAPLSSMADAAMKQGISTLFVTDHCDLLDYEGNPQAPFDWPAALERFHRVRAETEERLELRLGLEVGSIPSAPSSARRIIEKGGQDLDFVLGSSHNWLGSHGNREMYFTRYDSEQLARDAVECYLEQARTLVFEYPDLYDSLAHIVYPLRYIRRDGFDVPLFDYEPLLREIFTGLARTDHALEVNTYRGKDLPNWPPLLRLYKECGGRYVTLGADAHVPEDVGKGIPEATEMLLEAGFTTVTTFVRRRPVEHKIKD